MIKGVTNLKDVQKAILMEANLAAPSQRVTYAPLEAC